MKIKSKDFKNNEVIPKVHALMYGNKSPELAISDIPSNAETLAIIMDDPDAKKVPKKMGGLGKVWTHWIMWNILPESSGSSELTRGVEGITSFGKPGYFGPAPPDKEHTYRFVVFALNCKLDLNQKATKDDLIKAMKGHIVGRDILLGRFEDPKLQKKRLDEEAKK